MHFLITLAYAFFWDWVSFCLCSSLLFGFFFGFEERNSSQTFAHLIYPVLHSVSLQQQLLSQWFTGRSAAHWITLFIWHISSALLMKTQWFSLALGSWDMNLVFVWFLWVSLLLIFIYMHLVVCLFLDAFVIVHCTFIKINESNEPLKKASFILWLI